MYLIFKMILNQIINMYHTSELIPSAAYYQKYNFQTVSTIGTDNKRYSYCLSEKPVDQEIIHIGLLGAPASRNMYKAWKKTKLGI